jgi:hypothetical protein
MKADKRNVAGDDAEAVLAADVADAAAAVDGEEDAPDWAMAPCCWRWWWWGWGWWCRRWKRDFQRGDWPSARNEDHRLQAIDAHARSLGLARNPRIRTVISCDRSWMLALAPAVAGVRACGWWSDGGSGDGWPWGGGRGTRWTWRAGWEEVARLLSSERARANSTSSFDSSVIRSPAYARTHFR